MSYPSDASMSYPWCRLHLISSFPNDVNWEALRNPSNHVYVWNNLECFFIDMGRGNDIVLLNINPTKQSGFDLIINRARQSPSGCITLTLEELTVVRLSTGYDPYPSMHLAHPTGRFDLTFQDYAGEIPPKVGPPTFLDLMTNTSTNNNASQSGIQFIPIEPARIESCHGTRNLYCKFDFWRSDVAIGFNREIISFYKPLLDYLKMAKPQNYLIEWFYYFFSDNETNFNLYPITTLILQVEKLDFSVNIPDVENKIYVISIENWKRISKILERNISISNIILASSNREIYLVGENEISFFPSISMHVYENLIIHQKKLLHSITILNIFFMNEMIQDDFHTLFTLLPQLPNLRCLALKNCGLEDKDFDDHDQSYKTDFFKVLRKYNRSIMELDLSGNKISDRGVFFLLNYIGEFVALEILDLNENIILGGTYLFTKLMEKFSSMPCLKLIKIGRNCFKEEAMRQIFLSTNLTTFQYNNGKIYETSVKGVSSLLDRENRKKLQVDSENWVVALASNERDWVGHAMIFLEGMNTFGQRFFERYHITSPNMIGQAQVLRQDIVDFDFFHYNMQVRRITSHYGNVLIADIETDVARGQSLPFSYIHSSSYGQRVNCLHWCLNKLSSVGVIIPVSAFDLPSRAAQGKPCVFM